MKLLSIILLTALITPILNAFNIGYLTSDFGFPVTVDKLQWKELEEKGRTILQYNIQGPAAPNDWIGVSLVAIEREHLPILCLERMRFEFNEGVEELDLFVINKDRSRKLLRISTTDLPAFSITNSIFILEYNGLYRTYGDEFERKTDIPILRSGKSQSRIELSLMKLDRKNTSSPPTAEKLLDSNPDFLIRPWTRKRK